MRGVYNGVHTPSPTRPPIQVPWPINDTVSDTVIICLSDKIAGGVFSVCKDVPLPLPLPPDGVEVEADEKGKLVPLPRKVRDESKEGERADKRRRQTNYGYKRIVDEVIAFHVMSGVG